MLLRKLTTGTGAGSLDSENVPHFSNQVTGYVCQTAYRYPSSFHNGEVLHQNQAHITSKMRFLNHVLQDEIMFPTIQKLLQYLQ